MPAPAHVPLLEFEIVAASVILGRRYTSALRLFQSAGGAYAATSSLLISGSALDIDAVVIAPIASAASPAPPAARGAASCNAGVLIELTIPTLLAIPLPIVLSVVLLVVVVVVVVVVDWVTLGTLALGWSGGCVGVNKWAMLTGGGAGAKPSCVGSPYTSTRCRTSYLHTHTHTGCRGMQYVRVCGCMVYGPGSA